MNKNVFFGLLLISAVSFTVFSNNQVAAIQDVKKDANAFLSAIASAVKTDKNGNTVLHKAAFWGRLDVVKYLVEKGVDVNAVNTFGETALYKAAMTGRLDVVKYFVEKGVDIGVVDKYGETALHKSVWGCLDVVKYLVEKGVDVNAGNQDGQTALDIAQQCGHLDVVKFLDSKSKKWWQFGEKCK